jgi:hypothetical protein
MVPASNVVRSTGMGQSSLTNHQSVVTYTAAGPTSNGKGVLTNCEVRRAHTPRNIDCSASRRNHTAVSTPCPARTAQQQGNLVPPFDVSRHLLVGQAPGFDPVPLTAASPFWCSLSKLCLPTTGQHQVQPVERLRCSKGAEEGN